MKDASETDMPGIGAAELTPSTAALLHLIDVSNDAIIIVDARSRIRLVNRAAEKMFGCTASSMLGQSLDPLIPAYARGSHACMMEDYLQQHTSSSCGESIDRLTACRMDGTEFPVRITLTRLPAEDGILVAAAVHDLTQEETDRHELDSAMLRFRQITENIREVFYISNLHTSTMHYISPGYEQIWGRSCRSLYDDPASFIEAVHPDDRPSLGLLLEKQLRGERTETEYRIIRPDGDVLWIRDRAYPVIGADGSIDIVTGVAEDITALHEYRASILRNQAMISSLYDNIGVMIFIVDVLPDGEYLIVSVNPYYLRSMGLRPEQINGRTLSELGGTLIPVEAVEDVRAHYNECIRLRTGTQYEEAFDIGARSSAWLTTLRPLEDEHGRIWRIIGTSQDISVLKRVELELRELNETLEHRVQQRTAELETRTRELQELLDEHARALGKLREQAFTLDVLSDAIITSDHSGTIIGWNPAAAALYQVPASEVIGRSITWLGTSFLTGYGDHTGQIEASLAESGYWRGEMPLHLRNGQRRTIDVVVNVERDAAGTMVRMISIARDITDRKRMEEELRISRDQLSLANTALSKAARMKDEFLANMSHELRTPLTAIQILSEAMQDGLYGAVNDKQRKSLQTIEDSGQHLLSLINDILDLSKIEAGQLLLSLETCDAVELVINSVKFVRQMAERKDLTICYNLPAHSRLIQADPRRLKQVLINLLSNAVKFTPNGGKVGVDFSADAAAATVSFSIWDTGIGIAKEDFPNLFRPFTQLDSSLTRNYPGTGLGLALVHRMTDLHGGNVQVESTPGAGSRFTVTIPDSVHPASGARRRDESSTAAAADMRMDAPPESRADAGSAEVPSAEAPSAEAPSAEAPAEAPVRRATAQAEGGGALILIADDNETTLATLGEFLTFSGYSVITAHDGNAAVARAVAEHPDLILMDVQMPRLTGLDAMRMIRRHADPAVAKVPIVALTALAMPSDREHCLAAGADEYLSKPLSMHDLHGCIRRMLAGA